MAESKHLGRFQEKVHSGKQPLASDGGELQGPFGQTVDLAASGGHSSMVLSFRHVRDRPARKSSVMACP